MRVFITGTDTNIGKSMICSWLCLQTGYDYFKPIQTGSSGGTDSDTVRNLTRSTVHSEVYIYKEPLSPHLASKIENEEIDLHKITLPDVPNLIVEGAGGLLVPINRDYLMIDVIKNLSLPVILVTSSQLGTINHTLLSLEALRRRKIETLGVIMNGGFNQASAEAIEFYGKTIVLSSFPFLDDIKQISLRSIPLTAGLQRLFKRE